MRHGKIKEEEKNPKMNLETAIEQLYDVFNAYPLANGLRDRSCECCVTDKEISELTSGPLRELSIKVMGQFTRSAVTTFGDEKDFKHFLPRILELFQDQEYNLIDDFLTFEKLNYCKWENWESKEIHSIKQFFLELWKENIRLNSSTISEAFQIMHMYYDLETALIIWEEARNKESFQPLVEYVLYPADLGLNEQQQNVFQNWLSSDKMKSNLMKLYFEKVNEDEANKISIAYTILEQSC